MHNFDKTRAQHLISALLDQSISESELKELDTLLQESVQARDMYRSYTEIHNSLYEQESASVIHAFDESLPPPEQFPEAFHKLQNRLRFFQLAAACLAIFIGLSYLVPNETTKAPPLQATKLKLATVIAFSPDLACNKQTLKEGSEISSETLSIQKGSLTLKYENGAEIKIAGPAEYTLHDHDYATLNYGQLAAQVPEAAQGFTIDAPKAVITDLGTEFALNVTKAGKSDIFVYEGEVVGSLLGSDGNTLKHSNLYADDAVTIDSKAGTLRPLKETNNFIRIDQKDEASLPINQAYVAAVHKSKPVAYWRFSSDNTKLIPNEMNSSYEGTLMGQAKVEKNTLVFDKETKGSFVIEQAIQNINVQGHSIEMWVKPLERRKHMMALASIVALGKPQNNKTVKHLAYFGLTPKKTFHRHDPYNFWFASRFPARSGNYGINCYANQAYKGNQWYHLVCIKNQHSLDIYVNGLLANSVKHELGSGSEAYQFFVGQMDYHKKSWQFRGSIDEVALYDRPLSAEEIRNHYQSFSKK